MASYLYIRRIVGFKAVEHDGTKQWRFTETCAKELYKELAYQLRKRSGRLGGRPRTEEERCPCGEMTMKCAKARYHHCEPDEVEDESDDE